MRSADNSLAQRVHKMPSFAGRCEGGGAVPQGAGVPRCLLLAGAAVAPPRGQPPERVRIAATRNPEYPFQTGPPKSSHAADEPSVANISPFSRE